MFHAISYFENCGHSPAWPLVPRAMLDLDQSGIGFQPHVSPVWNDPCLVSIEDGKPKGFLIYRYDEQKCSWFILLAYVLPLYRRQGIHTALFRGLVERAERRGDILSIDCGTHQDNLPAQAAFEAQGRKKVAIMYEYRIKDWITGKPHIDPNLRAEG